jgi:hypothetical protein
LYNFLDKEKSLAEVVLSPLSRHSKKTL